MTRNTGRREFTGPDDLYYNYCWWPYQPVAPTEHKFRPVSLLFQSFEVAGVDRPRLRDRRGPPATPSGRSAPSGGRSGSAAAWPGNSISTTIAVASGRSPSRGSWTRSGRTSRARSASTSGCLTSCSPSTSSPSRAAASAGWTRSTCTSGTRGAPCRRGSPTRSGRGSRPSKISTSSSTPGRTSQEAAGKILCSPHVDATQIPIDWLLWPELAACQTICVANKRRNDTVYFSGVNVDQFLFFLKRLQYPREIVGFVEQNAREPRSPPVRRRVRLRHRGRRSEDREERVLRGLLSDRRPGAGMGSGRGSCRLRPIDPPWPRSCRARSKASRISMTAWTRPGRGRRPGHRCRRADRGPGCAGVGRGSPGRPVTGRFDAEPHVWFGATPERACGLSTAWPSRGRPGSPGRRR